MRNTIYKNHPQEEKLLSFYGIAVYSEAIDNVYHRIVFSDPGLHVFEKQKTFGNRKYLWGQLEFELFRARSWVVEKLFEKIFT